MLLLITSVNISANYKNGTIGGDKPAFSDSIGLKKRDIILIREAVNFQLKVGPEVWPDWNCSKYPILYKTVDTDYLINHPNPPSDFSRFYDKLWGDTIMTRPNSETYKYCAAFPVSKIMTVVVTAPKENEDPCLWVLMVSHELFHIYQGKDKVVNPYTGIYAGMHELSFPYNYSRTDLLAAHRIEAELLFNLLRMGQSDSDEKAVSKIVFSNMQKVFKTIFADSLHYKFKQWMEWSEGTARYTELRLADIASNPENYHPTKEFSSEFPASDYSKAWKKQYANGFKTVRFSGEKVADRGMFYISGMAKAYLLDRIRPDWKNFYFKNTLDALITEKD